MKRWVWFGLFVCIAVSMVHAQIDVGKEKMKGSTMPLKKGLKLTYGVDFFGRQYDFIVWVTSKDDGIAFDYTMTTFPNQQKVPVKIGAAAMDTARIQHNYFDGRPLILVDRTTVWVSERVFNELVQNGNTVISPDGGRRWVELVGVRVGHNYTFYDELNQKDVTNLNYVYAESADGKVKYWIHLSENNPLILRMDLGWKIWLKKMDIVR